MAYDIQLVVDAADAHAQADWWAQTLGWDVEPQDEAFIRKMIDEGHATEADTRTYKGKLVWPDVAIHKPDGSLRILFQAVPESKVVKNRVHLDVWAGADPASVVSSLIERGATKLYDASQGPHAWTTMADPEGNEFCVTAAPGSE